MKKMKHNTIPTAGILLATAFLPAASLSAAAVIYSTAGSTYTQNFSTLSSDNVNTSTWENGTTLTGWHWANATAATVPTTYRGNSGTGGTQFASFGINGNSDRAFGTQNSNGIENLYSGVQIENTTGFTLGTFTLTYTGEQWRAIGGEGADRLTFSYQVFTGTGDLTSGTWTTVSALDFIAPKTIAGSANLDGNAAANRVVDINATVNSITWANGQELWLRWNDNNPVNNSATLNGSKRASIGIDDVTFSAAVIPEPSALLLSALGLLPLLRRKR